MSFSIIVLVVVFLKINDRNSMKFDGINNDKNKMQLNFLFPLKVILQILSSVKKLKELKRSHNNFTALFLL
jgi:hypothetical protein